MALLGCFALALLPRPPRAHAPLPPQGVVALLAHVLAASQEIPSTRLPAAQNAPLRAAALALVAPSLLRCARHLAGRTRPPDPPPALGPERATTRPPTPTPKGIAAREIVRETPRDTLAGRELLPWGVAAGRATPPAILGGKGPRHSGRRRRIPTPSPRTMTTTRHPRLPRPLHEELLCRAAPSNHHLIDLAGYSAALHLLLPRSAPPLPHRVALALLHLSGRTALPAGHELAPPPSPTPFLGTRLLWAHGRTQSLAGLARTPLWEFSTVAVTSTSGSCPAPWPEPPRQPRREHQSPSTTSLSAPPTPASTSLSSAR